MNVVPCKLIAAGDNQLPQAIDWREGVLKAQRLIRRVPSACSVAVTKSLAAPPRPLRGDPTAVGMPPNCGGPNKIVCTPAMIVAKMSSAQYLMWRSQKTVSMSIAMLQKLGLVSGLKRGACFILHYL